MSAVDGCPSVRRPGAPGGPSVRRRGEPGGPSLRRPGEPGGPSVRRAERPAAPAAPGLARRGPLRDDRAMAEAVPSFELAGLAPGEPSGRSQFPPIADYAFLSDCETNCLIAPSGAVEWMCLPRPDSPSIFSALLDRSAGSFRIGPYDEVVPAARRYLPGSLVVETTWQTRTGWLLVRDALCMGPWHNVAERSRTHRRSPTDFDAEHCLLRSVECVSGSVDVVVRCEPTLDYGRGRAGLGLPGRQLRGGPRRRRRAGRVAAADHRPAAGHRGRRVARPHPDDRGGPALRGAVLVAAAAAARAGRGRAAAAPHAGVLAAVDHARASSRTTRGAATCSAARSPSRG